MKASIELSNKVLNPLVEKQLANKSEDELKEMYIEYLQKRLLKMDQKCECGRAITRG